MTEDQYRIAKHLMGELNTLRSNQDKIRAMPEREDDDTFNKLRELAYNGCAFMISRLQKEFDDL